MATLDSRLLRHRQGDVLTPWLDRYFRDPPSHHSDWVMEVVRDLATAKPRERSFNFSASSLASCTRAQTFQYLDYPRESVPNPRLQSIFLNGRWVHYKWQAILMEMGLASRDTLEVPVILPEHRIRGTIDAIVALPFGNGRGDPWIVDFKGVNPNSFNMYKRGMINQGYHWQLQIYMKATGLNHALLLYENKATGEYFEQHVRPDHDTYSQAMARLKSLNIFMELRKLPPPLPGATHNPTCRECPFQLDCLKAKWTDEYIDDVAEIPL